MPDPPGVDVLIAGCAAEARALAEGARGGERQRLLVLAHTLALAGRELAHPAAGSGEDAALAAALRAGDHDDELLAVAAGLRAGVASRLAVAHPGYDAA